MRNFILLTSLLAASAFGQKMDLQKQKSEVGFLAIGKPASLKIKGTANSEKKPLSGTLHLNGRKITGNASFDLDSLSTGIALRDSHMKEKYLQTSQHPKATLEMTELTLPQECTEKCDAKNVPFTGNLHLHGVEKTVSGTVSVSRNQDDLNLDFGFKLGITQFGIELPSYLGIKVVDEVEVNAKVSGKIET